MNNTIDFNTAKTIGTMSKKIDHIDDTVSSFFSFMHMVMFDVNKAIMRCLVKNLAMFGLGLYVYAGEDLPEDAAPQPEAELQKQPKPRSATPKQEQPPMPCICARCNQPIKRVKLKDGSIMQAAEFAATHEGMCADCYKATRLNVA